MVTLSNSFEGGTNGATVTPANSGGTSGTAFNSVNGTATYTTTSPLNGSVSMLAGMVTSSTVDCCWSTSWTGSWSTIWYVRDYYSIAGTPTVPTRLCQVNGAAALWGVTIDSATGKIGIRNLNLGSFAALSATVVPTATRHRYEFSASYSGTAWTVVLKLFFGANADGTTPDETLSPAAMTLGAATLIGFGANCSGTQTYAGTKHDSIVMTDAGFPGPLTTTLAVTTASLPGGTVGTAYGQTAAASGGTTPYAWSISAGALPAGLAINSSSGAITGTPTAAGTASFTVKVTDNVAATATQALSIAVSAAATGILQPPAGYAIFGAYPGSGNADPTAYETGVLAGSRTLGAWYRYYEISQAVPTAADLTLSNAGRILVMSLATSYAIPPATGGVKYSAVTAGTYDTQLANIATQCAKFTTPVLVPFGHEMDLSYTAGYGTAAEFIACFQHVANILRAGAPGKVVMAWVCGAGTATAATYYPGDAYVDWIGVDPYDPTLSKGGAGEPGNGPSATLTPFATWLSAQSFGAGKPFGLFETGVDQPAVNTDANIAAWINALPAAMAALGYQLLLWFNSSGTLGNTTIVPGSLAAAAMANIGGQAFFSPPASVGSGSPFVTTSSLPGGITGNSYSQALTAGGGTPPYTWAVSAGTLPAGLSLAASTGVISGTPTATGTSSFTVQVTDAQPLSATQALSIAVGAAAGTLSSHPAISLRMATTMTGPAVASSSQAAVPLAWWPAMVIEAGLVPAPPVAGAGTFILDDTVNGLLSISRLAAGTAWTDISAFAQSMTVTRPSSRQQGPLLAFQAATASIVLDNSDARFDPDNLAGPYVAGGVSQVRAMVPVRIRAVWNGVTYNLFHGFADGWLESPVSYEGGYSEVTLNATDAFKVLAGITLAAIGSPEGAGALTGARVADILTRAGWYTSAEKRVLAAGDTALQGTTLGDTALNLMQVAVDSEIGQLYVNGSGAVVFRDRRALITDARSAKVQAYFGDNPGAVRPGPRVGAYLQFTDMGQPDLPSAVTAWTGFTGRPLTARRLYFALSAFPGAITADLLADAAAGRKVCMTLRPAYNPVSATDLAALTAFLASCRAAGLIADVTLWHEPFYQGLSSAQYIAMVNYYGPAVRQYYPLVFVTSADSAQSLGELTYYPGDAAVDKVATDLYASEWNSGAVTLAAAATVADNAVPPKPFGLWECNSSTLQNFLLGTNSTFEVSQGNWVGAGNSADAFSTLTAHTGTGSLKITSVAAGNMSAAHCLIANVATQGLPCSPGDQILASAWFQAAATPETCEAGAAFYTSASVLISILFAPAVVDATTGWVQATGTVTAPAGAAWAITRITVLATAGAGEVHFTDDVVLLNSTTLQAQGTAFFGYVQSYFTSRALAGKVNADVLLFNANTLLSQESVITSGGDYRVPLFQALFDALDGSAAATAGELPAAAISRADDDTTIASDIQVTRVNGTLQEAQDPVSEALFLFPRTYARSDLILQTDADALAWASWVLYVSRTGENRFDTISADPLADPAHLWPQVLGREMGDRIEGTKRPPGIVPVTKDGFVSGITHAADFGAGTWLTTWGLQDASKYAGFLVLDSGKLGTGVLVW